MSYLETDSIKPLSYSYTHVVCGIIFWVFSFSYLYFYQADVLAAGQHVLSHGQTHYQNFIGAFLITLVLQIIQVVIFHLSRLAKRAHAITYFPSLLALTVITDVSSNINRGFSFGWWYVAIPLLVAAFIGLVWVLRQIEPFEPESVSNGLLSREMWVNLVVMAVMFVGVGIFSNGDEAFHYRMKMERLIIDGKYNKALKVGQKSTVEDTTLTFLRAFSLSKKGLMGEHFFEYPFCRGANMTLLPDTNNLNVILLPDSIIIQHINNSRVRLDFQLIDLLIDRKLDDFSKIVLSAYPDSLMPKHYAEALAVWRYNQRKLSEDSLLTSKEKGYIDFINFIGKTPEPNPVTIRRKYKKTYWYFYKYGKDD